MSLPEILYREKTQISLLAEITSKLEAIITLVCGSTPVPTGKEDTENSLDGFFAQTLFHQERVENNLNFLHTRLDDFRSMLGHPEEVPKLPLTGQSVLAKALERDLAKGLRGQLIDKTDDYEARIDAKRGSDANR